MARRAASAVGTLTAFFLFNAGSARNTAQGPTVKELLVPLLAAIGGGNDGKSRYFFVKPLSCRR